jgi:hypothetical protein
VKPLEHVCTPQMDRLVLEPQKAYPADADLRSLQRTVMLHRVPPHGWVELVDQATFAAGSGMLETALVTFGSVEIHSSRVIVRGKRGQLFVEFDPAAADAHLELLSDVDLTSGPTDLHRVVFTLRGPTRSGVIRMGISVSDESDAPR